MGPTLHFVFFFVFAIPPQNAEQTVEIDFLAPIETVCVYSSMKKEPYKQQMERQNWPFLVPREAILARCARFVVFSGSLLSTVPIRVAFEVGSFCS